MSAPYAWLAPQWEQLQRARTQKKLPHAWLLQGASGLGKRELATQFAKAMLCLQPSGDGDACNNCASCHQFAAGAHPDFVHVTVPEGKKFIPIDSIRTMNAQLTLTKSTSEWSVAIIEPAELMNRNAANALLKTLEEPTPNTLLILLTEQPAQLLATIRSRCVQLRFVSPNAQQANTWLIENEPALAEKASVALHYAGGAPLMAAGFVDNDFLTRRSRFLQAVHKLVTQQITAISVANEFKDEPLADVHLWLSHWLADLLRLQLAEDVAAVELSNADFAKNLQSLAGKVDQMQLLAFQKSLSRLSRYYGSNAQPQLLLENLLTELQM